VRDSYTPHAPFVGRGRFPFSHSWTALLVAACLHAFSLFPTVDLPFPQSTFHHLHCPFTLTHTGSQFHTLFAPTCASPIPPPHSPLPHIEPHCFISTYMPMAPLHSFDTVLHTHLPSNLHILSSILPTPSTQLLPPHTRRWVLPTPPPPCQHSIRLHHRTYTTTPLYPYCASKHQFCGHSPFHHMRKNITGLMLRAAWDLYSRTRTHLCACTPSASIYLQLALAWLPVGLWLDAPTAYHLFANPPRCVAYYCWRSSAPVYAHTLPMPRTTIQFFPAFCLPIPPVGVPAVPVSPSTF